MLQIDLLSYQLTPEESIVSPVQSVPKARINQSELAWQEAKLARYRYLIWRFVTLGVQDQENGKVDPERQAMRRYEIERLKRIRDVTIAEIKRIKGGHNARMACSRHGTGDRDSDKTDYGRGCDRGASTRASNGSHTAVPGLECSTANLDEGCDDRST